MICKCFQGERCAPHCGKVETPSRTDFNPKFWDLCVKIINFVRAVASQTRRTISTWSSAKISMWKIKLETIFMSCSPVWRYEQLINRLRKRSWGSCDVDIVSRYNLFACQTIDHESKWTDHVSKQNVLKRTKFSYFVNGNCFPCATTSRSLKFLDRAFNEIRESRFVSADSQKVAIFSHFANLASAIRWYHSKLLIKFGAVQPKVKFI